MGDAAAAAAALVMCDVCCLRCVKCGVAYVMCDMIAFFLSDRNELHTLFCEENLKHGTQFIIFLNYWRKPALKVRWALAETPLCLSGL